MKTLTKMKTKRRKILRKPRDSCLRVCSELDENLTGHSKLFQVGKAPLLGQTLEVAPMPAAEAVASLGTRDTTTTSRSSSQMRRTPNGSTSTQRKKRLPSSAEKFQAKLSCVSNLKSKKTDTCSTSVRTRTLTSKTRWTKCSSSSSKRTRRFASRQRS